MKTVLVIVQYPYGQDRSEIQHRCNELEKAAKEKAKTIQGVEQLDSHTWLIDASTALTFLAWLIQALESIGVDRRVGFLSEPPTWTSA